MKTPIFALLSIIAATGCNYSEPGAYERLNHCDSNERTLLIDNTFPDDRIAAILEGASFWTNTDPSIIIKPVVGDASNDFSECTITIVNMAPSLKDDKDALATTIHMPEDGKPSTAVVHIHQDMSTELPDDPSNPALYSEWQKVFVHEVGHAIGLKHQHYEDHYSIMEPYYSSEMQIGKQEISILRAIWAE